MNKDAIIEMAVNRVIYERERAAYIEKDYNKNPEVFTHVKNLREDGFSIIENFYSADECEQLRNEIDLLQSKYKTKLWEDELKAEKRLHGAEKYSNLIKNFFENTLLQNIGENYFCGKLWNSNTLAARIEAKKDNVGSGGGWHRDAHHFQFKAIVYLSDVNLSNGPFQIIRGSHWFSQKLKDMDTMKIQDQTTRYTDNEIQTIIDRRPKDYKVMTAPAGTVLLVDTSTLHTGMPLKTGERYALFNYYYPSYENKEARLKKWNLV